MSDIEQVGAWTMECDGRTTEIKERIDKNTAIFGPTDKHPHNCPYCKSTGRKLMFPTISDWVTTGYIREPDASVLLNDVLKRAKQVGLWVIIQPARVTVSWAHRTDRNYISPGDDAWDDLLSCLAQAKAAMEAKV